MHFSSTPVVPFRDTSERLPHDSAGQLREPPQHQLAAHGHRPRERLRFRQLVTALVNFQSWVLVATLVLSQFTCIVWDSQTTPQYVIFGQDPNRGTFAISGHNDEPYSDRSLVCVQQGRLFKPKQLSSLLSPPTARTRVVDATGASIDGYRIVPRHEVELLEMTAQRYALGCDVIAAQLEPIARACRVAGYNVVDTSSNLRVLDGISTRETTAIVNSLPVIILPYWDNAIFARYAMPAVDGSACVFHLSGQFDSATSSSALLYLLNRSEREQKTMEWLGISPNGGARWRNGWLEDPATAMKWYSDIGSSVDAPNLYSAPMRFFNLLSGEEIDCLLSRKLCHGEAYVEWWGSRISYVDEEVWVKSVAISNGTRYGLFLYEALRVSTSRSAYDLAMLISNSTVVMLLLRWLAASLALVNTYWYGHSHRQDVVFAGIGCLSSAHSFECLPLILLPRLAVALAAFFTAGCQFEGAQRAFSEAWFAIYPALAEVMLFYYGVLNLVAKGLGRRMNDVMFGPSLLVFCLLHWLRRPIANAGWFEFDGRISTSITTQEYEALVLWDFFTTDAALRLNGNVRSIFYIKLVVLAANLIPLVFSAKIAKDPWVLRHENNTADSKSAVRVTAIERALGVRARDSSGLGVSAMYIVENETSQRYLNSYELVRLGYCVFGDAFVIPLKDWLVVVLLTVVGARRRAFGLRVMAIRLGCNEDPGRIKQHIQREMVVDRLQLHQLQDEQLSGISVWNVSAPPLP